MKKKLFLCIPILLFLIFINSSSKTLTINKVDYYGERVERASEYLMIRANIDSVTSYEEGNMREMYTFNQEPTIYTEETTEYRYIGNDANNYVYFNCKDINNLDTCELWRMIGVFRVEDEYGNLEYRIKLMRNESIGTFQWDNNGTSDWNNSSIVSILNEENFWYSLASKTQDMIGMTKFYIGGTNGERLALEYYQDEKGGSSYNNYSNDFIGYVGLITPSDYAYTYSLGIDEDCLNNIYACKSKDLSWLNIGNTIWTMIPSNNSNNAYAIGDNISISSTTNAYEVYPTVYLKYDTVIEGGNGSIGDAYIIRSMNDSDYKSEYDMLEEGNLGEKNVVDVKDTSSNISKVLLYGSLMITIIGVSIILYNFIKVKKAK